MRNATKQEIEAYYLTHSNKETAEFLGISKSQMLRVIAKLGIANKVPYKRHERSAKTVELLLRHIDPDAFASDCEKLSQKGLAAKYGITIRQIGYLKSALGIGHRLKYVKDYDIDVEKLAAFCESHSWAEATKEFGISNITTLKNILKRHGVKVNKPIYEPLDNALSRIDRDQLQEFYETHTLKETCEFFDTGNLSAILSHYGIQSKTKKRETKESALARIDKAAFAKDYETLPLAELYDKYSISYTMYRKLVAAYGLGYKPGIFAFSNASLSMCEDDLASYVESLVGAGNMLRNDRTALAGRELDIYVPSRKIGIEFNGNYWHSDQQKPKDYHLSKSILAEKAGIRLIHIWEYEWQDPLMRPKLQQLLKIALASTAITKIYARNCEVRRISNKEAKGFNELTHLQGHRNAQVTYGLLHHGALVQLMSFSRSRYNRNLRGDNSWEIIRGCPGSNNIVIGGVSKLFAHFVMDFKPSAVFSYCDFNKFDGRSYLALGMHFAGYTGPDMKYMLDTGEVVARNPKRYKYNNRHCKYKLFGAGSKKYEIEFSKEERNEWQSVTENA